MGHRQTIFISYSHANRKWLQRLRVHLKPYEQSGDLELWDDTQIDTGDQWRSKIESGIARATAAIVLISPDFLASDFVVTHELPKLLKNADRSRILPVIVEPTHLARHPELEALQALNPPGKPLAAMPRPASEAVWTRLAERVGKLLAEAPKPFKAVPAPPPVPDSQIFEELKTATIGLSILWMLCDHKTGATIGEIEKELSVKTRKSAVEMVNRLVAEGWVEKTRLAGLTRYRLGDEGTRHWKRLAATADGPLRRAIR